MALRALGLKASMLSSGDSREAMDPGPGTEGASALDPVWWMCLPSI